MGATVSEVLQTKSLYSLLTARTLNRHLAEVGQQAESAFQYLVKLLYEKENVTEKLNSISPMKWVYKRSNIRNRAAEFFIQRGFLYERADLFSLLGHEQKFVIKNLIWFRNKLREEGRYTAVVDDLIINFSKVRLKKSE